MNNIVTTRCSKCAFNSDNSCSMNKETFLVANDFYNNKYELRTSGYCRLNRCKTWIKSSVDIEHSKNRIKTEERGICVIISSLSPDIEKIEKTIKSLPGKEDNIIQSIHIVVPISHKKNCYYDTIKTCTNKQWAISFIIDTDIKEDDLLCYGTRVMKENWFIKIPQGVELNQDLYDQIAKENASLDSNILLIKNGPIFYTNKYAFMNMIYNIEKPYEEVITEFDNKDEICKIV